VTKSYCLPSCGPGACPEAAETCASIALDADQSSSYSACIPGWTTCP
jgi:hypothetical protein